MCRNLLFLHDHQSRPQIRNERPNGLPLHLFPGGKRICHGHQGIRNRLEVDYRGEQPADSRIHLFLWGHCARVYFGPDGQSSIFGQGKDGELIRCGGIELLQQGFGHVLYQRVSAIDSFLPIDILIAISVS
jgi:hypothetical protein